MKISLWVRLSFNFWLPCSSCGHGHVPFFLIGALFVSKPLSILCISILINIIWCLICGEREEIYRGYACTLPTHYIGNLAIICITTDIGYHKMYCYERGNNLWYRIVIICCPPAVQLLITRFYATYKEYNASHRSLRNSHCIMIYFIFLTQRCSVWEMLLCNLKWPSRELLQCGISWELSLYYIANETIYYITWFGNSLLLSVMIFSKGIYILEVESTIDA